MNKQLSFNLTRNRRVSAWLILATLLSSQSPLWADPILDRAAQILKEGRANAAASVYNEYLRAHPRAVQPQLALAHIAMRRFEFEKARHILEKALTQHPESPEVAATLGRLFQQWSNSPAGTVSESAKNYQALAQEHLNQAYAIGARNPLVLTYMAEWQIQQNDLVNAEKNLQQALVLNPTFIPALQGQVRFYMKANDLGRARDAALHAIEIDPENSMSYFLTAQLLAFAKHPAEAAKYAEKSEQLDFGKLPERDYFLAGQYETLGVLDKAAQYYKTLTAYTPRNAHIWMKLGDLHDALKQPDESLTAYRKALQLKPDILNKLYAQARESTRTEKISLALQQWRKLLAIQPNDAATINEAWSNLASLHFLQRFLHPDAPSPQVAQDMSLLAGTSADANSPIRQMDLAKLTWASQGQTAAIQQQLKTLAQSSDPATAGEAAFLAGDYAKSRESWEIVDGLSAEEYTLWGDRLLLDQALNFAQVFYQRAYELNHAPELELAMKRIKSKQTLATQRLNEGNASFQAKQYATALSKYQEASTLYPEWDNAYLRLGDTYEQLKKWPEAKLAFDKAIALSPSLMDSKGFSKNYQRISKRASK